MQDNIYAAPAAAIADVRPAEGARAATPFFVVAPWKFVLMYVATVGLYRYYWSYMQWARFRRATGTPMWPVARSIFAIFYMHELNTEADHRAQKHGGLHWSPGNATAVYVVASIAGFVLDRMGAHDVGPPWLALAGLGMLAPATWALWRTQSAVNVACGDPRGTANNRLSWANWVWLAIGLLVWLLLILGTVAILLGVD